MKRGLLVRVKIKDRYERLQDIAAHGFSPVYLARVFIAAQLEAPPRASHGREPG
jgi:hypothetical protein